MESNFNEIKNQIVLFCKKLYEKDLIVANDGNISFKINLQQILITSANKTKSNITTQDISTITIDGKTIEGNPSSELYLHTEIYQKCPYCKCVIHAHPPCATSWSLINPPINELPCSRLPEAMLTFKKIPIVTFAPPGSKELGEKITKFLPQYQTLILAQHGAVAWGENLQETFNMIERLEHISKILLYQKML